MCLVMNIILFTSDTAYFTINPVYVIQYLYRWWRLLQCDILSSALYAHSFPRTSVCLREFNLFNVTVNILHLVAQ